MYDWFLQIIKESQKFNLKVHYGMLFPTSVDVFKSVQFEAYYIWSNEQVVASSFLNRSLAKTTKNKIKNPSLTNDPAS